jgi:O-antigen ligase
MLFIGTAGFLAGYYVMNSVELQLQWLLVTCLPAVIACFVRRRGGGPARDPVMRLAAALLVWNIGVSLVRNRSAFEDFYTFEFLAGSVLLPVFLACVWLVCRGEKGQRGLRITLVAAGGVAAVVSLLYWRLVQVADDPGTRLRNLLVHGGQHPVGTAMCLAFSLVAGATLYGSLRSRRARCGMLALIAVITLAVMLTLSRGALLALSCVPAAFLASAAAAVLTKRPGAPFTAALRHAGLPMLTVIAVALGFQFLGARLTPPPAVPADVAPGTRVVHLEKINQVPLREMIARKDNGRRLFYQMGLGMMDTWDKHLLGAGMWAPEITLERAIGIDHFHSIYVATYVHGGIVGSALLLALLALGIHRALALAQAGQPHWLALLAFGLGALIFDGQSLCSLVTHPRFENLILWFPLIGAAAQWRTLREGQAARQPSSSASR